MPAKFHIVRGLGGDAQVRARLMHTVVPGRARERARRLKRHGEIDSANESRQQPHGKGACMWTGTQHAPHLADTLAKWLRRPPARPTASPCIGSNPPGAAFAMLPLQEMMSAAASGAIEKVGEGRLRRRIVRITCALAQLPSPSV